MIKKSEKKRWVTKSVSETKEFFFAIAMLLKLYKARKISRTVYEMAEKKCRERLCA